MSLLRYLSHVKLAVFNSSNNFNICTNNFHHLLLESKFRAVQVCELFIVSNVVRVSVQVNIHDSE